MRYLWRPDMKPIYTYIVRPRLPEALQWLDTMAYNLWWSWHNDAIELFRRIDREQWEESQYNPVRLLSLVSQERLDALAEDSGFLAHMQRIRETFEDYMSRQGWFGENYPDHGGMKVAYFSAEYGIASCLQIYSGGLGILSGDHLKIASDLGLPLVAVGLAYRQGYFHQYLNADGWQQERYEEIDFFSMPVEPVLASDGERMTIDIPYADPGGENQTVMAELWRVNVGRVPLYLISTNLPENRPEDRQITAQLYGGDRDMRIRQEIVLGIGGVQVLKELGIAATCYHMNEGHSAFLTYERILQLKQDRGLDFDQAFEAVYTSSVFTTHTPVPAGNDVFDEQLVGRYLGPLADDLGIDWQRFMAFGRDHDVTDPTAYCMTVAALRGAGFSNGVSELHGSVSRGMWSSLWPELPVNEVPIQPITNGVHLHSWVSPDMAELYTRYLGPDWHTDPLIEGLWERLREVPDEELWQVHVNRRGQLVAYARRWLAYNFARRGSAQSEVNAMSEVLSTDALTIGFARRFATYKRATLLLRDIDRLKALVGDAQRPVQIIIAGKAHPRDDGGKNLIRDIIHAVRDSELRPHIVFLEDYDISMAKYLVQGCDVWLNTPRRPLEASGTSGMKAVANGALHLSTLDGWWAESYSPDLGWAIGGGEEYEDTDYQDEVEGASLYDQLEREIIPLFWERGTDDLPRGWIARMKSSISTLTPRFSSNRMLRDYIRSAYVPSHKRYLRLASANFEPTRELAGWRRAVEENWEHVSVRSVELDPSPGMGDLELLLGQPVTVTATLDLGDLSPDDVRVEAYCGVVDPGGSFTSAQGIPMQLRMQAAKAETGEGEANVDPHTQSAVFTATVDPPGSGHFGITVRVLPSHPELPGQQSLGLVTWA
jgi:starch phosphorylase